MKYTVLGFQKSGQSATKLLLKHNHNVFVSQNTNFDKQQLALLKTLNIDYEHTHTERVLNSDCIVVSPGIPFDIDILKKAKQKNIKIIPEIELAFEYIKAPIIAITGTNGKSTTTYMLYQILIANNKNCAYGGNIKPGIPLSEIANNNYDYIVCEVSSFQLEHIDKFNPYISIITNISQDHLNRHINMNNYINAKLNILKNHNENNFAILNDDCNILKSLNLRNYKGKLIYVSYTDNSNVYFYNNKIYINFNSIKRDFNIEKFNLPGKHNIYNLMQALMASLIIDKDIDIKDIVNSFKSLPHRMEFLGIIKNHPVYNNSMCTNPIAFKESVSSLSKKQTIIVGGKDKNSNIDIIVDAIIDNVKNVILIGDIKDILYDKLNKKQFKNIFMANSLKQAIKLAFDNAEESAEINFSPGFASFDMFKDFADRGEQFKNIIKEFYE